MIAHTTTIKPLLATHGGLASLPRASLRLPDPLHQCICFFFSLYVSSQIFPAMNSPSLYSLLSASTFEPHQSAVAPAQQLRCSHRIAPQ
jgi:hypothetical protein